MFGKEVYIQRRKKLMDKMSGGLILLLGNAESPMNYRDNTYHFRQDSSFLYFLGIDHPNLAALLDTDSREEILFGDDVDMDAIIWMGQQESIREKADTSGIRQSQPFEQLHSHLHKAIKQGRKIHFLPPYRAENKILLQDRLLKIHSAFQADYASLELIKAVIALRSVKETCEIEEIKKACETGYEMHIAAMKMAQPGVWEQKIAGTLEGISIAHGNSPSYPIILSQNGETLHNHSHQNYLEKGQLMLVDAGAESEMHYASDFTRTNPVGGKYTDRQLDIYNLVVAANDKTTSLCMPGKTYLSIHLEIAALITRGLKELGLMKGNVEEAVKNGAHALFMPHGLGHMMGLDVHDMEDLGQTYVGYDAETRPINQFGTSALRLGRQLQKGFVLTNEPGIYFIPALIDKWEQEHINAEFINFEKLKAYRNFGGIRLEDNLLITSSGCEILGKRVPIYPDEVECVMNS